MADQAGKKRKAEMDALGRVKDLWQCTPANCGSGWFQMTYNYNELSAVTSQTNPMGFTLTQTWNPAGIMTALTSSWSDAQHPGTLVTVPDSPSDKGYNPAGAMIKAYLGNGLIETRAFNVRGQPTEMRTYSTGTCTPMPACQDVMKLTYGFADGQGKNNGNVLAWIGISKPDAQSQKLDFNRSYTYDQLNRIASMFSPGEACLGLNWDYDIWGNRLHQNNGGGSCNEHHPGTSSSQNRILTQGYGYDAAGNLTAEPGKTYQYDAENRLKSINNGAVATYTYDTHGNRVRKQVGSTITDYIYDVGGSLVAERQGSTWVKGYVYFNAQLLAQYSNSTTYFTHKDHLGSTRLLTTVSGSSHETYDFLPFGEPINNSPNPTTTNQFTGQLRDVESNLDYFKARYYSSVVGRFTSTDPLVITPQRFNDPQQLNAYGYARNNPLRFVDPNGEELTISGDINAAMAYLCEIAGDDCYRLSYDPKTSTVTIAADYSDEASSEEFSQALAQNEGLALLFDLVSSGNRYDLSAGPSVETAAGRIDNDHLKNLPLFDDQVANRQCKCLAENEKPRAGISDQVAVYLNNPKYGIRSLTNLKPAVPYTVVFHELAEAYAKIDGGKKTYENGHSAAMAREIPLREQRPYLREHNPGSGGSGPGMDNRFPVIKK